MGSNKKVDFADAFRNRLMRQYRGDLELARMYLNNSVNRFRVFMGMSTKDGNDMKFLSCLLTHIDTRIGTNGFFEPGDCLPLPNERITIDCVCTEEVGHFVATLQEFAYGVAADIDEAIYWLGGFEPADKRHKDWANSALLDAKAALKIVRLAIPYFSIWVAKHGGDKTKDVFAEKRAAYWQPTERDDPQGNICTDAKDLCEILQKTTRRDCFVFPLNDAVSAIKSLLQAGDFHEICDLYDDIYDAVNMFTMAVTHFCAEIEFEEAKAAGEIDEEERT